jgi:type 1 fimbria pilin
VSALLENAGIANGDTVALYHRVLASDGSVFTPSEAFTIRLTRDTTLNVNTFDAATTFSVFPNPASDVLTINSNSNSQNVNIQLIDITGKQLYAKTLNMSNTAERVNISALEQGVYLLSINDMDSGKIITKRIVKK